MKEEFSLSRDVLGGKETNADISINEHFLGGHVRVVAVIGKARLAPFVHAINVIIFALIEQVIAAILVVDNVSPIPFMR